MDCLKTFLFSIDCYGSNFHFYLNHKQKHQSIHGGFFTIITLLLIIISIKVFGTNFFKRKKPTITSASINQGYSIIDLKKEKVVLAFRFEDIDGNFIDCSGKIFPIIYYYSKIYDNSSHINSFTKKEEYLTYHICNGSDYGNYNLTKNYGNLYCIDWENKNFGGYWENSFLFYFEIRLYFCKNGKQYSKNNPNCTSLETLSNILNLNNPIYFSLYYPIYQFNPNSLKNPLIKTYKNYFYFLDHKLQKNDRLFIKQYYFYDDQGWLFQNFKKQSLWGVDRILSDYSYSSEEDLSKEGSSSLFYTMNIYMEEEIISYTRYYTKIQEVIAVVGGLSGFICTIFRFICNFINLNLLKIEIIESIFNFESNQLPFYNMKNHNNFDKYFNSYVSKFSVNDINLKNYDIDDKKKSENGKKNLSNFNKKSICEDEEKNCSINSYQINVKNKKTISLKNSSDISDTLFIEYTHNKNISPGIKYKHYKNKKKGYKKLTLFKILYKDLIDCLCKNKKNKNNLNDKTFDNIYLLLNWIYKEFVEIYNYFSIIKDLLFLINFLLKNEQKMGLLHSKKLNLSEISYFKEKKEKKNNFENISNIINYYKNVKKSKRISKIDYFTLYSLDSNIKKYI